MTILYTKKNISNMKSPVIILSVALLLTACNRAMVPSTTPMANTEVIRNDTVKMLLGRCEPSLLKKEPYKIWWDKNYNAYQTDTQTTHQLKPLLAHTSMEIFLGTWCGDSKRETPRMLKLLEAAGYPKDSIRMICVDNAPNASKQSPQHEEQGKNIFRVPTFIIYHKNKEVGRIVETPVASLEKDLLAILAKENYTPNHKAVGYWITHVKNTKTLSENKLASIAAQIKPLSKAAGEFNSYGYLLLGQKNMKGAINVFRLNTLLFPTEANTFDSLGEAYMQAGNIQEAIANYERVLAIKPGHSHAAAMLAKLKTEPPSR